MDKKIKQIKKGLETLDFETLNILRVSVSHYLEDLEEDYPSVVNSESYNDIEKLYIILVDLTFNRE